MHVSRWLNNHDSYSVLGRVFNLLIGHQQVEYTTTVRDMEF